MSFECSLLRGREVRVKMIRDGFSHNALNVKRFRRIAVVVLYPNLCPGHRVDQSGVYFHTASGSSHVSL